MSRQEIEAALGRVPRGEIDTVLRHRVFAAAWAPGTVHYAAEDGSAACAAAAAGLDIRAVADPADLKSAMQKTFATHLNWLGTACLADTLPGWSARIRITNAQRVVGLLMLAIFLSLFTMPFDGLRLALGFMFAAFFLAVIALRVLSALPLPAAERPGPVLTLPVYTVMVPLFRETAVLRQLMRALLAIDYPRDLLDIKLVIEKGDLVMRRALAGMKLPAHMEIIVVPPVGPQTKPKALNYAMAFARGELVTIFDAEDIPHRSQLRAAAAAFAEAGPRLACLQAELAFYNPRENWLTRQFAAEYAWLFGRLLPVLASLNLPLMLGGTSNHFRIDILREVGAWDAYNVTEDADLGLRLARFGYRSGVLPSRTYEEANCRLKNWMQQRARWLKGWMQTWLVHMRSPARLVESLGWAGFLSTQALLLGVVLSALVHPFFLGLTLWSVFSGEFLPAHGNWLVTVATGTNLAVLLLGYLSAIYAAGLGLNQLGLRRWYGTLLTMPVYWLLISAAAWLALWQLIRAPFHWNKTEHGISRQAAPVPGRQVSSPQPSPFRASREAG